MNIKSFLIVCITLLLTFIVNINLTQATWQIEDVEESYIFSNFSLTERTIITDDGVIHIAYGADDILYYSYWDGIWHIETVESSANPYDSINISLAVDSSGKVHISYSYGYYDGTNWDFDLKYANNASGSWVTETLTTGGDDPSLAIDSQGKAHISYRDATNEDLKYTTNASGSWIAETLTTGGDDPSLAIDSQDAVHISYSDPTNNDLKYITNGSGSWVTETVDNEDGFGYAPSLAIDSQDKVHISYVVPLSFPPIEVVKYATNASGSWVAEETGSFSELSYFIGSNSLALDSSDKAYISYSSSQLDFDYLIIRTNASGSWKPLEYSHCPWQQCIAMDSLDKVHVIYYDGLPGSLRHHTNATGTWVTETVVSRIYTGIHNSLALDAQDKAHISYRDETNEDLKYATNISGSWIREVVDSEGNVGYSTSLALDSQGKVHISYYGDYVLKYATNVSGSWVTETVDSENYAGFWTSTSLALDLQDKVHISYNYDYDGYYVLKYATNASGTWVTETVDSESDVRFYEISLALDSQDKAHISYCNYPDKDLKYATNLSGSWVTEGVVTTGEVTGPTSLAIDSQDKLHISYGYGYYYDRNFYDDLRYATNASGSWVMEIIDSECDVRTNSLALDSQDKIHISYSCGGSNLRYANNTYGPWAIETLVPSYDPYSYRTYPSLAIDSQDKVHISFYYRNEVVLKYFSGEITDTDGDNTADVVDNCPDVYNPDQTDADGDCVGNVCDDDPNDPDNPIPLIDSDSDGNGDACDTCTDTDGDGYGNPGFAGNICINDNCLEISNPDQDDVDEDYSGDICDNCPNTPNLLQEDTDNSGIGDACNGTLDVDGDEWEEGFDNCLDTPNPDQVDSYPPQGNGIGDACDCEADFNCDGNVDAADVTSFLTDFGRSTFFNPCSNADPCNGDVNCDVNVDAADVAIFLTDFGRSPFFNPCPACVVGDWCVY